MNTLFRTVFACKCKSTHHKLALDALRHLRGPHAQGWQKLFLKYYETYLEGSKAPDKKFKDFRNHVLHVSDNYWGGAVKATEKWYNRTVEALQREDWKEAVYAAGVMTHYYTDPIQPFHTGQSETEGKIHRAAEWSITKSYDELRAILEEDLGGYPEVEPSESTEWLAEMVRDGAELAHPNYQVLIDHYDLKAGVKDPPAGLDQESKDILAVLIGHAAVGTARILERAFAEASARPPRVGVTLYGFLAKLTIPLFWVTRNLASARDREVVEAIYAEVQRTGKAIASLPEDERTVRRMHAEEVRRISLDDLDAEPAGETGTLHGQGTEARPRTRRQRIAARQEAKRRAAEAAVAATGMAATAEAGHDLAADAAPAERTVKRTGAPNFARQAEEHSAQDTGRQTEEEATRPADQRAEYAADGPADEPTSERRGTRFYLEPADPVVDGPSIGPKTANRLARLGVQTVDDLLAADAEEIAHRLNHRRIDADVVRGWQSQARLVCRVPGLRGHDAQLLVACDFDDPEQIAQLEPTRLFTVIGPFASSPEGQRIIRDGQPPDLDEVTDWVRWAGAARELPRAA